MIGLLKEKSEIEKLKREYQILAKFNFELEKKPINTTVAQEELILEECAL
ncbi:hypothetical protein [Flavobacterium sp. GNP002]